MAALAFFSPGPMELMILFVLVGIPVGIGVIGVIVWLTLQASKRPRDAPHLPPCPMCGAGVSPNATSCPHCGEPLGTGGDEGA